MQGKCCPSQPAIKAYNADAFAAIENSTFDWCTPDRRSGGSRHRKRTAVEDPAARVTGCRGRPAPLWPGENAQPPAPRRKPVSASLRYAVDRRPSLPEAMRRITAVRRLPVVARMLVMYASNVMCSSERDSLPIDTPAHAEAISEHAEGLGPERRRQWHRHLTAL